MQMYTTQRRDPSICIRRDTVSATARRIAVLPGSYGTRCPHRVEGYQKCDCIDTANLKPSMALQSQFIRWTKDG